MIGTHDVARFACTRNTESIHALAFATGVASRSQRRSRLADAGRISACREPMGPQP
jgi:hypothetical protein